MDKKTTNKIAVIVVVIIIAFAAVSYFALNPNKETKADIASVLPVFGNANNDYVIDDEDLAIVQDIIDGKKDFKDYPLANAYYDDAIDQKDLDQIRSMIDKTATSVWHINEIGTDQTVAETKWPVKAAMATATPNVAVFIAMLHIADKFKAISYSKSSVPDTLLIPEFEGMKSIGGSTSITYDQAATYIKDGCTAVLTSTNASYMSNYQDMEDHGVDVIRVDATGVGMDDFLGSVLMLAYLFDANDNVEEICKFCEDLEDDVEEKLSKVTSRPIAAASTTTGSLTVNSSDYAKLLEVAGAVLPSDSRFNGTSSIKVASADWLYDVQIDKVVNIRTGGGIGGSWYEGTLSYDDVKSVFDVFSKMKAYENNEIYIIDGELPIPLRLIYAAEVLFPEIFEEGYVDGIHQQFCDRIYGEGRIDVSSLTFIYEVADYK